MSTSSPATSDCLIEATSRFPGARWPTSETDAQLMDIAITDADPYERRRALFALITRAKVETWKEAGRIFSTELMRETA